MSQRIAQIRPAACEYGDRAHTATTVLIGDSPAGDLRTVACEAHRAAASRDYVAALKNLQREAAEAGR